MRHSKGIPTRHCVSLAKGCGVDAELQHPMSASILTTPLFVAIQEGNSDTAKALVARGANINRTNDSGYTPPMRAASDDPAMVNILLELGADPNFYRSGDGANVLSFATHCENKENAAQTVRLLIEAAQMSKCQAMRSRANLCWRRGQICPRLRSSF